MPKFEALKISDLFTAERCAGRVARVKAYRKMGQTFTHIVACEASDGSWCEFDAESLAHAERLANNAVDNLDARGCSVWAFGALDGYVGGRPAYTVFASYDEPKHPVEIYRGNPL
jgi:hypothetical protein